MEAKDEAMLIGFKWRCEKSAKLADVLKGVSQDELLQALKDVEARREAFPKYKEAKKGMEALLAGSPELEEALVDQLLNSSGQLIAMASEMMVAFGVYHNPYHGNEMYVNVSALNKAQADLEERLANLKGKSFFEVLAGAMGAAHDIIQHFPAPKNEQVSEQIFLAVMQPLLHNMATSRLEEPTKQAALKAFADDALPMIAREGLVNGTYLHFGAKLDHKALMDLLERSKYEKNCIPEDDYLNQVGKAIAASDVRRSELSSVMEEGQLLKATQEDEAVNEGLALLLNKAGFCEDVGRSAAEQEGFLIRLTQNYRMATELVLKFNAPKKAELEKEIEGLKSQLTDTPEEDELLIIQDIFEKGELVAKIDAAYQRQTTMNAIRSGELDVSELSENEVDALLLRFFDLADGEIGFAKGLAKHFELAKEALPDGILAENNGWGGYPDQLLLLKGQCINANAEDRLAMAKTLVFMAAKQPGMTMAPEIFQGMEDRLQFLLAKQAFIKGEPSKDPGFDVLEEHCQGTEGFSLEERIRRLNTTLTEVCLHNGYKSELVNAKDVDGPLPGAYAANSGGQPAFSSA